MRRRRMIKDIGRRMRRRRRRRMIKDIGRRRRRRMRRRMNTRIHSTLLLILRVTLLFTPNKNTVIL